MLHYRVMFHWLVMLDSLVVVREGRGVVPW